MEEIYKKITAGMNYYTDGNASDVQPTQLAEYLFSQESEIKKLREDVDGIAEILLRQKKQELKELREPTPQKECEHIWDSETVNPNCFKCGKRMRTDKLPEPKTNWKGQAINYERGMKLADETDFKTNWERDFDDTYSMVGQDIREYMKVFIRNLLKSQREEAFREGENARLKESAIKLRKPERTKPLSDIEKWAKKENEGSEYMIRERLLKFLDTKR